MESTPQTLEQWKEEIEDRVRALEVEMNSVTCDDEGGRGFEGG